MVNSILNLMLVPRIWSHFSNGSVKSLAVIYSVADSIVFRVFTSPAIAWRRIGTTVS
jgi:hypothetical protein